MHAQPSPAANGGFAGARLVAGATDAIWRSPLTGTHRRWAARDDAEELLAMAIGASPDGAAGHAEPTAAQRRRFDALVDRRVAGEPMALLRGHVDFCGLTLIVRPGVFVPRPSSEMLAAEAIRRLRRRSDPVAIDVACGIGPVALAVAHTVGGARVVGVDISAAALTVARVNRRRLGIHNVEFRRGDLLSAVPRALREQVDVMTAHPPYVPRGEVRFLPREIRRHEPRHTLTDASADGLGMVRRLAQAAPSWLRRGGWLLIELSPDRARPAAAVLRGAGLDAVRVITEAGAPTRVVAGRV
ncbi:MAG TPA: HemK/PrmC family methyltransferase [Candidatus Dormibacteraeota bacterium]